MNADNINIFQSRQNEINLEGENNQSEDEFITNYIVLKFQEKLITVNLDKIKRNENIFHLKCKYFRDHLQNNNEVKFYLAGKQLYDKDSIDDHHFHSGQCITVLVHNKKESYDLLDHNQKKKTNGSWQQFFILANFNFMINLLLDAILGLLIGYVFWLFAAFGAIFIWGDHINKYHKVGVLIGFIAQTISLFVE